MTKIPDTALGALAAFDAGTLTPENYLRALLERCEADEERIRAWSFLDPEIALANLHKATGRGKLRGLPVAVKDNIHAEGMPRTCGSPIYSGSVSTTDASVVSLGRIAGAYAMGKTETTEFATYKPAPTHNPAAFGHTPGGSSSGSAAAVAAGMVPFALGTQTAGSVIRPAAFCGIVGYKPTFDLIDMAGVKGLARSFDTLGVFARSVQDAALFAEAVTGLPLLAAARSAEAPQRLGLCRSPAWNSAEPELQSIWDALCSKLGKLLPAKDIELPGRYAKASTTHPHIMTREAYQALSYEWHNHRDLLSPQLSTTLGDACKMSEEEHASDRAMIAELRQSFHTVLGDVRVLLAPSAAGPAPQWETGTGSPAFNQLWTLLGVPCVNVPGLTSSDGRPIGVQVIARMGCDAQAMSAAAWLSTVLH